MTTNDTTAAEAATDTAADAVVDDVPVDAPVDGMGPFTRRAVGIRFILGEKPLFQVNLPMLRCESHFTQWPAGLPTCIRWDRVPPRVQGVLLRSCPIEDDLPRLSRVGQAIRYVPQQYPRFFADLTLGWPGYLDHFTPAAIKGIRYEVRRFARLHGLAMPRSFRRPEEMAEFYRLARAVSRTTYQERLLRCGLPEGEAFEEQLRQRAQADEVRGFVLMDGQRPVAYSYCLHINGLVLSQFLGYDSAYARLSPGTVLMFGVMEHLLAEGRCRLFDFGQGFSQYKKLFSTGSTRCADVYYLRRTLKNALLVRLHSGMDCLSTHAGNVLHRIGLKTKLKKWLRQAA